MEFQQEENSIHRPSELATISASGIKLTPMMEQYFNIKKSYPDTIVFYRMGDFYELFFEDAKEAAKLLNITLTHRGKLGDTPIPMAGIPHHAANAYLDRLTAAGKKVVICEQVEDPKMAKGIVKRAVTQIVSPGMPYDLDKASHTDPHFMASVYFDQKEFHLALIDFTTGEFFGQILKDQNELLERLQLFSPKEMVVYMGQWDQFPLIKDLIRQKDIVTTHLSQEYFEEKISKIYIEKLIPSYWRDRILQMHSSVLRPIGALAYYICSTQSLENIGHIRPFRLENSKDNMKVSYPTLTGLEIFPRERGLYQESILGFMDKTMTSMGSRFLKLLFQKPLQKKQAILKRQSAVIKLKDNSDTLSEVRAKLAELRDVERMMAKLATGRGQPGDLINLAKSIFIYDELLTTWKSLDLAEVPTIETAPHQVLMEIAKEITLTINDEIGASLDKGNLILEGVHKNRDKLAKLSRNVNAALEELETQYRQETGIGNLKVKSNNISGFFIEVSKSHINKVPKSFTLRQTLVNASRYTSKNLADLERDIVTANDKLYRLEREIFDSLINKLLEQNESMALVSNLLSFLDVMQSLAWVANQEEFTKPEISDKKGIHLKAAWHPLIKKSLKSHFVPHDINLSDKVPFGLITGPNMAGKTTVMREVAIIQFLTQLGSLVPAAEATVSLCDYLFSRLGASDDILRGQSTFMVEMSETAEIIRHASAKSLIVLDEIGRGTSTYDGLSIAWALVEYLANEVKALTLFSTHYHELIELVDNLKPCKNLTVKTINDGGKVQFLYHLIEEGAAQSYGIHVAKLAGLPKAIIDRSNQILQELESSGEQHTKILEKVETTKKDIEQLDFFTILPTIEIPAHLKQMESLLNDIDPLNTTPLEALKKLAELKDVLKQKGH